METTESINKKTTNIDSASTDEILRLINSEDAKVAKIVGGLIPVISQVVELITDKIKVGGRLIYCGAGTSGRLAVADNAELYPTYNLPKDTVITVIAGGYEAVFDAKENKEDSFSDAIVQCKALNISKNDVVLGVSANGGAPFVYTFLKEAKNAGAHTIAMVNNTNTLLSAVADITIEALTGAEVIHGSTRMKAGTSQKMMLNMISTAVCIKLGRVYKNFMSHMVISNNKLKSRGINIVCLATGVSKEIAETLLSKYNYCIQSAINEIIREKDLYESKCFTNK